MKKFSLFLSFVAAILMSCSVVTPAISNQNKQTQDIKETKQPFAMPTIPTLALDKDSVVENWIHTSNDCKKFGEAISNEFIQTYNGMGCKFAQLSIDGKYIAYATLYLQTDKQGSYFTDAVRVTQPAEDKSAQIHLSLQKNYVAQIAWGPKDQLMIWEAVWEDSWVLFIYDSLTGKLLAKMRTDTLAPYWNPEKNAFYVLHSGEYGKDICVSELGGFDFDLNMAFPDLYSIFDVERDKIDLLGIPYSTKDSINVEPYSWSSDGKKLWLIISQLKWQGNAIDKYKIQPQEAGLVDLYGRKPQYITLASNSMLDYYFNQGSQSKVYSKPYLPKTCPP